MSESVEELAGSVLDVINNKVAVVSIRDSSGAYLYVNDAYEQLTKTTRSNVLGKTLADLHIFPENDLAVLLSEDALVKKEGVLVRVDRVKAAGKPVRLLILRAYITYHNNQYLIGVTFERNNSRSDEFEITFGNLLVWRLRALDQLRSNNEQA